MPLGSKKRVTCNPRTWEAKAGGSLCVPSQSALQSETLAQKKEKKNQPTNQEPGWVDGGVPAHKAENTESSKLHTGSGRGKLWNAHARSGGPN